MLLILLLLLLQDALLIPRVSWREELNITLALVAMTRGDRRARCRVCLSFFEQVASHVRFYSPSSEQKRINMQIE